MACQPIYEYLINRENEDRKLSSLTIYIYISYIFFCRIFCTQSYQISISFGQIYLSHRWPRFYHSRSALNRCGNAQGLPLHVRADLGVMTMKQYSSIPRSLKQEPHQQLQFSVISKSPLMGVVLTLCGGYCQPGGQS